MAILPARLAVEVRADLSDLADQQHVVRREQLLAQDNEMAIDGELRIRLPSFVIYADDPQAVDQLRRALDLSGPSQKVTARAS